MACTDESLAFIFWHSDYRMCMTIQISGNLALQKKSFYSVWLFFVISIVNFLRIFPFFMKWKKNVEQYFTPIKKELLFRVEKWRTSALKLIAVWAIRLIDIHFMCRKLIIYQFRMYIFQLWYEFFLSFYFLPFSSAITYSTSISYINEINIFRRATWCVWIALNTCFFLCRHRLCHQW